MRYTNSLTYLLAYLLHTVAVAYFLEPPVRLADKPLSAAGPGLATLC